MNRPILYSVLDLAPIVAGSTAAESLRYTLELAQDAERLGYHRYWVAEHHNMAGIASAATSVVIGYIAAGTQRIRVGAGGIMLPNHAPLVIAEQFGTLESLYPGRIDLGLGRAPGSDAPTARALRRGSGASGDSFPLDVQELRSYFRPATARPQVRAIPGEGLNVPLYLLGSSDFSARLAAHLGLPFAFASHFAPDYLHTALQIYRREFQPSEVLERPHVIIGVNVFAAETEREALRLMTSLQQAFLGMLRGMREQIQPPVDHMNDRWSPTEKAHVEHMMRYSVVGAPATVRDQCAALLAETAADELMLTGPIYDHQARRRSFAIAATAIQDLNAAIAHPELQPVERS